MTPTLTPYDGPALVVPPSWRDGIASIRGERALAAREVDLVRLPTGDAQLIVHITSDGGAHATVAGPSTYAKYRRIVPGPFYVQLVLRPDAARAVLGVPVHELADRVVELAELWGGRADEIIERVVAMRDAPQVAVHAIEGVLAPRMRTRAPGAQLARRAAELLRAASETPIAALAAQLGASERSLRQAFLDHVGVSPKRYARIERMRQLVAAAGSARWTQLAADHAFYDQAHLNAEFRALLGVTPGQWLAGQLPFVRSRA